MRKHRRDRFGFGAATVLVASRGRQLLVYTHPLLTKKAPLVGAF